MSLRGATVGALAVLSGACGGGSRSCEPVEAPYIAFPFSGEWAGSTGTLCLTQRNMRTVTGSLDGTAVTGAIAEDGTLTLQVSGPARQVYVARLRHDSLHARVDGREAARPGSALAWTRIPPVPGTTPGTGETGSINRRRNP